VAKTYDGHFIQRHTAVSNQKQINHGTDKSKTDDLVHEFFLSEQSIPSLAGQNGAKYRNRHEKGTEYS
jgi:hypothetical protein